MCGFMPRQCGLVGMVVTNYRDVVTGTCKLSGLEGTPKGIYAQIELSEQGKAENPMDNPAKNNKRMNLC